MASKYWVGGDGNWSSLTNWRTTSGGAVITTAPGSADAAVLDANSSTSIVTVDSNITIQTLTCTGFTGTLAFGTNTISLNSTGTIFTGSTTCTVTGTPLIICTDSSATARTVIPALVTESNSISFRITAGTGTFTISTTSAVKDLDFTDGVNPTGYAGALTMSITTVYGNFKASTGMTCPSSGNSITFASTLGTKTINTAGVTFDRPFTFNGVGGTFQLVSALTSGATRTATLTNGTLDLASYTLTTGLFSSSNANIRTLAFGTGKIVITGTNASVYSTPTATGLTLTGSRTVEVTAAGLGGETRNLNGGSTGAGGSAANAPNFYIKAGVDSINLGTVSRAIGTVDFTGFSGSTTTNILPVIYGDLVLSTGMTVTAGTAAWTFAATTSQTITTNGKTLDVPVTFDGVGGTWTCADALTLGSTRTLTLTNGTLNLNGYTLTTGTFSSSNSNIRTLAFGTGKFVLNGTNQTIYTTATATNLTITGTPLIQATGAGTAGQTRVLASGAVGEASAVSVDVTAGADTVTFSISSGAYKNINLTGFTGTIGFSNSPIFYGNFDAGGATATTGSVSPQFLATSGTQTINFNGLTLSAGVTFGSASTTATTFLLSANFAASANTSFSGGTLNLSSYTITTNTFTSSATTARTLAFGTGKIVITGNNTTVFSTNTGTNLIVTGSKRVEYNYSGSTGTRQISGPLTATAIEGVNLCDHYITAGTDTFNPNGARWYGTIDFTGFGGTFSASSLPIYGNLVLSSVSTFVASASVIFSATSGTKTITSNGKTIDGNVTFSGVGGTWSCTDALTLGSTQTLTMTNGTLDLNGYTLTTGTFSSSNSNTRTLAFGTTGKIVLTSNSGSIFAGTTSTGITVTGTAPLIQLTDSSGVSTRNVIMWALPESQSISLEVLNNATDTVAIQGTSGGYKNIDTTNFNGTLQVANSPKVFGNFTVGASVSAVTSIASNPLTFASTSGTKTITTNGKTIDAVTTFDGVGGTWTLQDALTLGSTRTLTLTNGTLTTNGYAVTAGLFASSNSNTRALNLGASAVTISGTGTPWNITDSTNMTLNAGTSSLVFSSSSAAINFQGGNQRYNNVTYAGGQLFTVYGNNTFNSILNVTNLAFQAGSTQSVYSLNLTSCTLNSTVSGVQFNLYNMTGQDIKTTSCTIKDSSVTPVGYWYAPLSLGNVNAGNNTGWDFGKAELMSEFMNFLVS